MVAFGLDISHHQDLSLDLARCKREGISFVFIKSSEGSTFTDPEFAANLAEARAAGLMVAAYHYVRSNSTAADQVTRIRQVVPSDVAVILDVEDGSGGVALVRDLASRLQAAGYRVPLLYLPRWYWQRLGSPSLAGLPPLWSSRYPDRVVGTIADEWAAVPASYWAGYGGLPVAVLQFTSSAVVAGHYPLDANAFRGSVAELATLLGQEADMNWEQDRRQHNADRWLSAMLTGEDVVTDLQPFWPGWASNTGTPPARIQMDNVLIQRLNAIEARPAADVDEAALATELATRGIGGVSAAELLDILSKIRLVPGN